MHWTRKIFEDTASLYRYFGETKAVVGVRPFEYSDGQARGLRAWDVRSGGGLRFSVLLDRGFDIGEAEFRGIPLDFRSPMGPVHSHRYEAAGIGWLRSFGGGLLTTCGLTQTGAPSTDDEEALPMHGRASHISAEDCSYRLSEEGAPYLELRGTVREIQTLKYHLKLERKYVLPLGSTTISVQDRVTNMTSLPCPHMLLYHVNVGYPLLDEGAHLDGDFAASHPRDEIAAAEGDQWSEYAGPTEDYPDIAHYHTMKGGEDGWGQARLGNASLGLALNVRFRTDTLPYMVQWKHTRTSMYGAGLEPSTGFAGGRLEEQEAGRLQVLAPYENRQYRVDITLECLDK